MPSISPGDLSGLLAAWSCGDREALDRLMPTLYDELRRIARQYMEREPAAQTLESAALVNEAYLRLLELRRITWQDRAHVLAISARMMRRVLVEHARKRRALKRGGLMQRVSLEEAEDAARARAVDLIELDDALLALAEFSERSVQMIELRFFGGLTVAEAAKVLGVSEETVLRDWKLARAWLFGRLKGPADAT